MRDILQEIVANKRVELLKQKSLLPPSKLYAQVEQIMGQPSVRISMSKALLNSDSGIIAEFKRRSPSKGWIKEEGRAEDIPLSYAENGAAALSILTDEQYFGGQLDFIRIARPLVPQTPILRKDFIIDEYQLFEARMAGADAVLLIAADLTLTECRSLARTAHELGLETLLEIHTEQELDYTDNDCIDMIGVNNRNLGTFHTDVSNSYRLASLLPEGKVLVSESGISHPDTVRQLRDVGFRGFLIGETFMRTEQPGTALAQFITSL